MLLLLSILCPVVLGAEGQFATLKYPHPQQCERQQCLEDDNELCREELPGYYLKERGCTIKGMGCTSCLYGNLTYPTLCICEYQPTMTMVDYGENCDQRKGCLEGKCYRPCGTYLHISHCEVMNYCLWNQTDSSCVDRPPADIKQLWSKQIPVDVPGVVEGANIVLETMTSTSFPMNFDEFKAGSAGYSIIIPGESDAVPDTFVPLTEVASLEIMFVQMDTDANGLLNTQEFSNLPVLLGDAEVLAVHWVHEQTEMMQQETMDENARRLQAGRSPLAYFDEKNLGMDKIQPEVCKADGGALYCPLDLTCKPKAQGCSTCGWKTSVDRANYLCVQPSPKVCKSDGGGSFCPTDMSCHPAGDCSNCPSMPISDHAQHKCLEPWWEAKPRGTWTSWVCRLRAKVGMKCTYDQDCVHGMKRCLLGVCQSLRPYDPSQPCASDLDCPHVDYYCPLDPTAGEDPYWVQFCRKQRSPGEKCAEDRECGPGTICNTVERPPRCREYFSMEKGEQAVHPNLCIFGWTDKHDSCAVPAKSKARGRSCGRTEDCKTTDLTGKTGECACRLWWDAGEPKHCLPVAGDMQDHLASVRDWLWFRSAKCGTFWDDEECIEQHGAGAKSLLYRVKCELQTLANGPHLPPPGCGITGEQYVDFCA